MTVDEGALLLLRRTEIISEQGTHIATSEINYRQAKEITSALQAYPLALDQAGAYIKETQLTLSSYLKRYRFQQWHAHISGKRRWSTQDHFDIVRTTLTLSLKKI